MPSVVDFATGRVRASVNVPLADIALRDVLRERLGMPVVVDNDATCAALAEAYGDDGALVARHLVMFTIGTGVGGGIVIDGRVYRGATGAAAELGHTIVGADLRRAPFAHGDDWPQPGSLESLAAGPALNELGREHGLPDATTVDAAREGHPGALAAIDLLGRRLGVGIANAINTFDPDLIVVGGGVSAAGELLLAPAREEAARYVLTGVGTKTQIRQARYGPRAGVRGAALLAGQEAAEHEAGVAMRIALAVDHAGVSLRTTVHDALRRRRPRDRGRRRARRLPERRAGGRPARSPRAPPSAACSCAARAPACRSRHASCPASARRCATTTTRRRSASATMTATSCASAPASSAPPSRRSLRRRSPGQCSAVRSATCAASRKVLIMERDGLEAQALSQVVNVNARLAAMTQAGTSVWLDQIRRSLTQGGELRRLVEEDSLRGVTSNPAIFEKAILGSQDYDEQIERLAREGLNTRAVYQDIVIQDVQEACDELRSVYDELGGADGFVSLEVDPDLAFDTERTIAQAREYWGRVDRPNVMIKIPGTSECLPAIEQAIYEGINVNVTLLFSVEAYATVAEAYIRGLERRHAEGLSLDVRSVASFFVSRVDSEVDKRLEKLGALRAAGQGRDRQRARRLPPLRGDLPRRALRRAGGRRRARAAAAVGVDGRQEPEPTPTRCTSRS